MKHTKKRQSGRLRRQTRKNRKTTQMTTDEKMELSKQIREYSSEDIAKDYARLRDIGCKAKDQSTKMLVGNRVVDAFTFTERLNTIGSKGISFYDFWKNREFYSRKKYVKKYLAFANRQHNQTTAKVWYNLYRFYFTSINCFRPLVEMEYYCMFSPKCVLDMTAGWGGRLVGACALDIPNYIGIDNNLALKEPYGKLCAFLQPQTKTHIDMRFCDALTVDYSVLKYDMVFTSPPYYDLEQYGTRESMVVVKNSGRDVTQVPLGAEGVRGNSEERSSKEFRTKEEWDNTFYRPLFRETYQHLAKGGHYCLNIPVEIFERVCRDILGEPWKRVSLKKSDRQQTDSSKKYVEYVYIWKK